MVKRGKRKPNKRVVNRKINLSSNIKTKSSSLSDAPLAVRIAAIYFYINAILIVIFGLFVFVGAILGVTIISSVDSAKFAELVPSISSYGIENISSIFSAIIALGFFIIVWGLVIWMIGSRLYKGSKIAFIAASILIFIGLIGSLIAVISFSWSALVLLAIYLGLSYCLYVNKSAREYFELDLLWALIRSRKSIPKQNIKKRR